MVDNDLCSFCEFKGTSAIPLYVEGKRCRKCKRLLGGLRDGNAFLEQQESPLEGWCRKRTPNKENDMEEKEKAKKELIRWFDDHFMMKAFEFRVLKYNEALEVINQRVSYKLRQHEKVYGPSKKIRSSDD